VVCGGGESESERGPREGGKGTDGVDA